VKALAQPRKELALVKVFLAPRVLTLERLCEKLSSSSSTMTRRLNEHGYYSSYNHSGRFLTIEEVADFDSRGLWHWKTARFSKHGNLKQTIVHFVQSSEEGMTHSDLATFLGVRAHNPLLELVEEAELSRERLGPTFVYLSSKRSVQRRQVRSRKSLLKKPHEVQPNSRQIIATLLELIKDPKVTQDQIVLRCQTSGISISGELVAMIFDSYDLSKKRAL
jgi:hypothetical protein